MNAEVIIVGGGIIGCAAAYNLAKNGVSVLVLEIPLVCTAGKVLESITHKETPWLDARKGFLLDETSHAEISLDAMKAYFKKVDEKYNIRTEDGLRKYIAKMR